jgi:taurine dioxygenase
VSLKVVPLTGALGAAVDSVDLHALDDASFADLHRAFLEHCVLVFRGQHLKEKAQLAFARRWGEPVVTPMLKSLEGYPEIVQITNPGKSNATTEVWHYDASFAEAPPKITILSALIVPHGGDTMWTNQYLAYERLSDGLKKMLAGLRAEFVGARIARFMKTDPKDIPPGRLHPIVRTHPETERKALYVGHWETMTHFEGWTAEESRPLLDHLYESSFTPDNIYRHMWQPGDVVMWDNRCTMHFAVHDYGDAERVLNRVTLKGEVPA